MNNKFSKICSALKPGCVHVWVVKWNECISFLPQLIILLSTQEHARASRLKFEEDRQQFIIAHAVLRLLSATYLKLKPEAIQFFCNKYGKPFFKLSACIDKQAIALQFNMSHSGQYVAYAFTLNRPVGIDIEYIKQSDSLIKIAERFFSAKEYAALSKLSGKSQVKAFYHCWARKEAFIKGKGKGLSHLLKKFDVNIHPDESPRLINIEESGSEDVWSMYAVSVHEDYAGALAVKGDVSRIDCRMLTLQCESPRSKDLKLLLERC